MEIAARRLGVLADALGGPECGRQPGLGQQRCEFLAAEPPQTVGAAQAGRAGFGEGPQALVTDPLELWGDASVLITWTNLAALCAGFLIAGSRGRWGGGRCAARRARSRGC